MSIEDLARIEELLGMGPIPLDTPAEAVLCWLQAKRDDLEAQSAQEDRDAGIVPLCDAKLFVHVLRTYRDNTVMLADAMEILRKKKRRGHKQQEALDVWDTHYKAKDFYLDIPDESAAKKAKKGTTK
jgi:hypothetical protein